MGTKENGFRTKGPIKIHSSERSNKEFLSQREQGGVNYAFSKLILSHVSSILEEECKKYYDKSYSLPNNEREDNIISSQMKIKEYLRFKAQEICTQEKIIVIYMR